MDDRRKIWVRGVLLIFISSGISGFSPSISQKAMELGAAVETILFSRYFLGAVAVWAYLFIRKVKVNIGAVNIAFILGLGLVTYIATVFMNESYKYIPGAVSSFLVFFYPAIVVVIEIIMGRERVQVVRLACLLLSVSGLLTIMWTPAGGATLHFGGLLFGLAAAFLFAMYAIGIGAKRLIQIPAEVIIGYVSLISMITGTVRCVATAQPFFPQGAGQWGCIMILGFAASCIAPLCYCRAIKIIGASDSALINSIEPAIAFFAGIAIMSDKLPANAIIGGILIVSAIVFLNLFKRRSGHG